jgi:hypothetical protein
MVENAPEQTRADFQHIVDRQAQARPNTAYLGSYVNDDGPGNLFFKKLLSVVSLVIGAIVVWLALKLLLQR